MVILLLLVPALTAGGCDSPANESSTSSVIELTPDNFEREVIEAGAPVLVEFWAPWCRPCLEMAPAMENLAEAYSGVAKVSRIRINTHPQLAERFEVDAPPVVIVFRDGNEYKRRYGKQTEQQLFELISISFDMSP